MNGYDVQFIIASLNAEGPYKIYPLIAVTLQYLQILVLFPWIATHNNGLTTNESTNVRMQLYMINRNIYLYNIYGKQIKKKQPYIWF